MTRPRTPNPYRAELRRHNRQRGRLTRRDRAALRTGKSTDEVNAVDKAVEVARENPPTVAGALAVLVGGLFLWLTDATEFPTYIDAALIGLGTAAGALVGKIAQRWTFDRAGADESWGRFIEDLHKFDGNADPGPGAGRHGA